MSQIEAIIQHHCPRRINSEITKLLKVSKSTVYHVLKKFNQIGISEDRPRSGRPRTAQSKKYIIAVLKNDKEESEEICKTNE